MKLPKTYKAFAKASPRVVLDLSPAERAALPDAEWDAYTAPEYGHLRSINTVGTWFIGHPRETSSNDCEPVELKYATPMPEGEDYHSLSKKMEAYSTDDLEWWQTHATHSQQDLGYIYNQDFAKEFVNRSRRLAPGGDPLAMLEQAGFKVEKQVNCHKDNVGHYCTLDDDKRGQFAVQVTESRIAMTHQKRSSRYWTNLLNVGLGQTSHDEKMWIPRFWSPEVASPLVAAADMALCFVHSWKPVDRLTFKKPRF